jgi:hypothetical protein
MKISVLIRSRRLPIVFAMHRFIHQIEEMHQAIFVGFFGPIGVSAIFYLYISLEFLEEITVDGVQRPDAEMLSEVMMIVIWFLAICSIVRLPLPHFPSHVTRSINNQTQVVHGLSIPLGKLGFFLPRTLSRAFTSQDNSENNSFEVTDRPRTTLSGVLRERRKASRQSTPTSNSASTSSRPIYRIGGKVIRDNGTRTPTAMEAESRAPSTPLAIAHGRTIRFPDEDPTPLTLSEGDI